MAGGNGFEDGLEPSVEFDAVHLCCLDELSFGVEA